MKKIIPRGLWVLVKPTPRESHETEHGIILPAQEETEQKAFGIVQEVGADVPDIEKGDEVVYGTYSGEQIDREEKGKKVEYKLILEEDIIAFLK